jgi:hypothetical protein
VFVNDIYLYGSVVWLRMIYDTEKRDKFQKLMKIIKIGGVYLLNPAIMVALLAIHIYMQDAESYNTPALSLILLSTVAV